MSEGLCFLLVEIANQLQRFCSSGGPVLCIFSGIRRMSGGFPSIFKCAPPLNEFLHFFLMILRWESVNFSRFR